MDNALDGDNKDTYIRRDLRRDFNQVGSNTTADDPHFSFVAD
jgi:hypothetical protein